MKWQIVVPFILYAIEILFSWLQQQKIHSRKSMFSQRRVKPLSLRLISFIHSSFSSTRWLVILTTCNDIALPSVGLQNWKTCFVSFSNVSHSVTIPTTSVASSTCKAEREVSSWSINWSQKSSEVPHILLPALLSASGIFRRTLPLDSPIQCYQ
jgi:hypothetical protein